MPLIRPVRIFGVELRSKSHCGASKCSREVAVAYSPAAEFARFECPPPPLLLSPDPDTPPSTRPGVFRRPVWVSRYTYCLELGMNWELTAQACARIARVRWYGSLEAWISSPQISIVTLVLNIEYS